MPRRIPFQLLEIDVISAQDLAPITKSMRTYAVAWVRPERKLTTRVDKQGHANPTWNDKFVFRVDDAFIENDSSAIMIDIYALSWLRDVRVGTVRVLINNLISASNRSTLENSRMRFVALQIRRPSGRPQGILNMGVTLLDSTMRSMPLYTELSASALGYRDMMDEKTQRNSNAVQNNDDNSKKDEGQPPPQQINPKTLRRTQSERTDKTANRDANKKAGSLCNANGSVCNGSVKAGSEIGVPATKAGLGNGSLCSDVGPSPSVVAAAIAKGIYPKVDDGSSSILVDDYGSVEGLKSKIERWRTELPPIYDRGNGGGDYQKLLNNRGHSRRHTDGGGLFSCFGNAYGCEFTIVCGANNNTKKKRYASGKVHLSPSDDNASRSFV
ncbi:hypothetical protein L1049_020125 [Liquidambar formosana]|uniref:C2 domain-containing protein n=1 Tax=Liquidambar formosana TaxID=63359 RepID=A0AAP0X5S0_LIQFO